MTDEQVYNVIYENLLKGGRYGKRYEGRIYTVFNTALMCDGQYFYWRSAGSGANRVTMRDLRFIVEDIFGMTPKGFVETFELRSPELNYCDELYNKEIEEVV